MIQFGSTTDLQFQLTWCSHTQDAINASTAHAQVLLAGEIVWGDEETPFTWDWSNFLAFLGSAWNWLWYEELYPIPINPLTPLKMWSEAERRWEQMGDDLVSTEQLSVYEFESVHNLAKGFDGIHLPPLFLLKQGNEILISTEQQTLSLPISEVKSCLESLGETIYQRLQCCADEAHAKAVMHLWQQREQLIPLTPLVTGLTEAQLQPLAEIIPSIQHAEDIQELHLAARMVGHLSSTSIEQVLNQLNQLPHRLLPLTTELDKLAEATRAQLAQLQDEKPFIQGYVLADWLRAKLSLVQGKVQPQHLLKQLCVDIQEVNLEDSIQAIACWREHMQPVILLNIKGTHHKTIAGQNASLAHELCHLLVDRHHALPAIEVLGGRLPKSIEQRANAFAAEFLLPRKTAAAYISQFDMAEMEPKQLLNKITQKYQVSKQLAAHQILNADAALESNLQAFLSRYELTQYYS